jgi:hypothetical protein
MSVEGVLQSAAALRARGVQPLGFHGEPIDEPIAIGWMLAVAQYFFDPDGHLIEFIAILDEAPDADFGIRAYSDWLARKHLIRPARGLEQAVDAAATKRKQRRRSMGALRRRLRSSPPESQGRRLFARCKPPLDHGG